MYYKTDFNSDYTSCEFLQKKFKPKCLLPALSSVPRGINSAKKQGILKLLKFVNHKFRSFWVNMPVSDNSPDLLEVEEDPYF